MTRRSTRSTTKAPVIYQFKISLRDIRPLIWRRIQAADGTLADLHDHIQAAMGWDNAHLFQFRIEDKCYASPEMLEGPFADEDVVDARRMRLSKLLKQQTKGIRFEYEYDFGDSWMHDIAYEGCEPAGPRIKYPRCTDGALACPPEDIGGPWGYCDFLEIIANPKHPRHRNLREWLGGDFDPLHFDAKRATTAMRKGIARYYE